MKKVVAFLLIFFILLVCACNIDHQCDDTCDPEIEAKKEELTNVNIDIYKASIKARKIHHYIRVKLRELRDLYSNDPKDSKDQERVSVKGINDVEADLETDDRAEGQPEEDDEDLDEEIESNYREAQEETPL